jgi:hypothetical protein
MPADAHEVQRTVGVLLPEVGTRGGFAGGAELAVAELLESPEGHTNLDVRHGALGPPPEHWTAVLCHGVHSLPWISEFVPRRPDLRVVLTDRMPVEDNPEFHGVGMVDWQWPQAAYLAGVLAARLAADTGRGIGLIAGPSVPVQLGIATAFTAGVGAVGQPGDLLLAHTRTFLDTEGGRRIGALMAGEGGCAVVAHTADSAGEEGCREARSRGAHTIGFLEPIGDHEAVINSDVSGVVAFLLRALMAGTPLPAVYEAGLQSGHLGIEIADLQPRTQVQQHQKAALLL